MSKIALDLKQFRHLKSDNKSTTLQHKTGGHTLILAHKTLSPEAQAQLAQLAKMAQTPSDSAELNGKGMMADGGEVHPDQVQHLKEPTQQTPKIEEKPKKEPNIYYPPLKGPSRGGSGVSLELPKKEPLGKVIRKAEGGTVEDHECKGAQYCMHCGGKMDAQMYAEGSGDVQPDDNGPWNRFKNDLSDIGSGIKNIAGGAADTVMGLANKGMHQDQYLTNTTIPQGDYSASSASQPNPNGDIKVSASDSVDNSPTPDQSTIAQGGGMGAPTMDKQNPTLSAPVPDATQTPLSPKSDNGIAGPGPSQAIPDNKNLDQAFQVPQRDFSSMTADAAAQIHDQDQKWAQDLANGHIEPKTYAQLFHDKSIPGKIATIFGMMAGGIGSGLTGTPNAALSMMDKIIQNDMQAQTTSKSNAQNFLRMSQDHEFQKAQQKYIGTQGQVNSAQAAQIRTHTNLMGYNLALMKANRAALQQAVNQANSLPKGSPEWQNAQQHLAMMANAVQTENYDLGNKAAAQKALMDYTMTGGSSNDPEAGFQQQQMMRRMQGQGALADAMEQRHIANIPGQASGAIPQEDRDQLSAMNMVNRKGNDILSTIKNSSAMDLNSPTSPVRKQLMQKVDELKTFYNTSTKGGSFTEGRLGWLDEQLKKNPGSMINQILQEPARFQEVLNSNADRLDQKLSGPNGLGFPKGTVKGFTGNQSQQQQRSGPAGTKPVMFQGKVHYVPIK